MDLKSGRLRKWLLIPHKGKKTLPFYLGSGQLLFPQIPCFPFGSNLTNKTKGAPIPDKKPICNRTAHQVNPINKLRHTRTLHHFHMEIWDSQDCPYSQGTPGTWGMLRNYTKRHSILQMFKFKLLDPAPNFHKTSKKLHHWASSGWPPSTSKLKTNCSSKRQRMNKPQAHRKWGGGGGRITQKVTTTSPNCCAEWFWMHSPGKHSPGILLGHAQVSTALPIHPETQCSPFVSSLPSRQKSTHAVPRLAWPQLPCNPCR